MFKNVLVRRPCKALVDGITSAPELGKPDYRLALKQHDAYIETMRSLGVEVTVLDACEQYPDSCFVEDPAVITPMCAIITCPGALSRRGETDLILPSIRKFFSDEQIEYIKEPGTLEGGDVMMVGTHFYIGESARTNKEGIRQFISILEKYGMTGTGVPLEEVLHLKTGVNYIGDNTMLVSGEFIDKPDFAMYKRITVPQSEAYASNCVNINGTVVMPEGYPLTKKSIEDAGFNVVCVDTSEYRKIDGGLSCLSLRF